MVVQNEGSILCGKVGSIYAENPGELQHKALKVNDYLDKGFKKYNTQKLQLIKKDVKYFPAFEEAKKHAKEHY